MSNFNPDAFDRARIAQAEQAARLEQQHRKEREHRNRPLWTRVNKLELAIAIIIVGAVVLWFLYVALS